MSAPVAAALGVLSAAHGPFVRALAARADEYGHNAAAWHRVGSPVLLDRTALERDVAGVRRLVELVGALPDLAFDGDRAAHHRFLGLDPDLADLLADDGLGADFFSRPDCVLAGGRLRALELNIGTGTINITAAAATELYFATATPYEAEREAMSERWNCTDLGPAAGLAQALIAFGEGEPVGLWYHAHSDAVHGRVADLSAVLAAHGADTIPVPTPAVADFRGPLYAYFSILHLLGPDGPALRGAVRAARARSAPTALRPGDLARTSKANLALLHQLATDGRLSDVDTNVVRTHLPETVLLSAADPTTREQVRREREAWVIKPSASFRGLGVHIGRSTSRTDWDRLLATADGVAQRFVPADDVAVLLDPATDPAVVTDGRLVLMPHLLAGRFAGMSARFSPDHDVLGLIDFDSVFPAPCVATTSSVRSGT